MGNSNEPWAIAPVSPIGDKTPDDLYRAVGLALSTWESVDEICAWIFAVLVDSKNGAAELAYGTVVSSSARMEMIKAAAGRALFRDPSLVKELERTLKVTGRLGQRRNEIAHGIVSGYEVMTVTGSTVIQLDDDRFSDIGFYLVPARYATRKRGSPAASSPEQFYLQGTYAYVAKQVLCYEEAFRIHGIQLRNLLTQRIMPYCREHWQQPQEPDEQ